MKRTTAGLMAILFTLASTAVAVPPEREAHDNRLISKANPAATIEVPRSAVYLGAERWDLYDIADCELHLYVEADADKRIKALYWIQFEGYLPNNTHSYDYSSDEPVTFAGLPFWQRARFVPSDALQRPGSDGERVRQMIERAGYTVPEHSMFVRLVHVLGDAKRQELMFIYGEDLGAQGFTTERLMDGDKPRPEWDAIKNSLVERARQRIRLTPSR